jgi:hypothetical protein
LLPFRARGKNGSKKGKVKRQKGKGKIYNLK